MNNVNLFLFLSTLCTILSPAYSVLEHTDTEHMISRLTQNSANDYELQRAALILTNEIERVFNKILSLHAERKRADSMNEFNHQKMKIDPNYLLQPSAKQIFDIIRANTNDVSDLQRLLAYLQSEKRYILNKQRQTTQSHKFVSNYNFNNVIYFYGVNSTYSAE
eukprot:54229_1